MEDNPVQRPTDAADEIGGASPPGRMIEDDHQAATDSPQDSQNRQNCQTRFFCFQIAHSLKW